MPKGELLPGKIQSCENEHFDLLAKYKFIYYLI